ncbi:MAG: glycosyltransferase family A protein [Acidobacteriota bacterium]
MDEKGIPAVSVIIPSKDYGSFIERSVESVLAQTIPASEIIVIDDGSADDTKQRMEKFGKYVKYHYLDCKGVGAARNLGIKNSSGQFIAHLDADDYWVPEKLEIQLEEFYKDPKLEIAGGMMQPFFDPGISKLKSGSIYCSPDPLPGFSASVILVKRKSFLKVGYYGEDLKLGQDLDWFLRARESGLSEKMVEKTLAHRRLHENNSSMKNKKDGMERIRLLKLSLDRRRGQKSTNDEKG